VQAFCFGPHLIELDLGPEFSGPITLGPDPVALIINGVPSRVTLAYIGSSEDDTRMTILAEANILPTDIIYLRLLGSGLDSLQNRLISALIKVTNAYMNPTGVTIARGIPPSTSISPSRLTSIPVIDATLLSGWSSTPLLASNLPTPEGEFVKVYLDPNGSSLQRGILQTPDLGLFGEIITFSIELKTPENMEAYPYFYRGDRLSRSSNTVSPDWSTISLSLTLTENSEVGVGIAAVNSQLIASPTPYVCIRNAVVSSNLRGVIYEDPLSSPRAWVSSGSAPLGSATQDVATWREYIPSGALTKSEAILSNDRLIIHLMP